jgi:hypothetical protein
MRFFVYAYQTASFLLTLEVIARVGRFQERGNTLVSPYLEIYPGILFSCGRIRRQQGFSCCGIEFVA